MSLLVHQRCLNHATREAAAKCLSCGHFFCRECVTEHENRMICANCLSAGTTLPESRRRRLNPAPLILVLQAAAGLLLLWFTFYGIGRLLLVMPSSFHEGTVWTDLAEDLAEDLD